MNIPIKDRDKDIEFIRLGLCAAFVSISYQDADLVNRIMTAVKKKKGKFNLEDAVTIRHEWDEEYKKKFEVLKEEEINNSVKE